MSALVLDAGAFVAVGRNDRAMMARLRAAHAHGIELRTHPLVVAQVWRDARGRQANLARLLKAVDVVAIDDRLGRACGALLGAAHTDDPIDAAVVLIASSGNCVLTGDAGDIRRLAEEAGRAVRVIAA